MVTNWRIRYSRKGPAVWLAHLDQMRTFERSIRRAGIPVAYSGGFNPRPQLAFALPIGVGIATEDDYVDVKIDDQQNYEPDVNELWCRELNRSLPEGLEVQASRLVTDDKKNSLMSRVTAARYRLSSLELAKKVDRFQTRFNEDTWMVEKQTREKRSLQDIKPLILDIQTEGKHLVELFVCAGSQKNLRPELFLQLLKMHQFLSEEDMLETSITRTELLFAPQHMKVADTNIRDWVSGLDV